MGKFLYGTWESPLPDIYSIDTPELQAEFPYAVLCVYWWDGCHAWLRLMKDPAIKEDRLGMAVGTMYKASGIHSDTAEGLSNEIFTEPDDAMVTENSALSAASVRWTNHNIYEKDGVTLYMEKSPAPVPVPQLNQAALMQGFATMLSLRRNRT